MNLSKGYYCCLFKATPVFEQSMLARDLGSTPSGSFFLNPWFEIGTKIFCQPNHVNPLCTQ